MPKPKTGRKPLKLDPEEIRHLASLGCTKEEIAAILTPQGSSKLLHAENLEKRFSAVMVKGRMELHRNLRSELVQRALNGNIAALIFALKVYCKMDDKSAAEADSRHLTIHFDYNQAKSIETRAVPIREAVTNMLANYRKDVVNSETPLLEDREIDLEIDSDVTD